MMLKWLVASWDLQLKVIAITSTDDYLSFVMVLQEQRHLLIISLFMARELV